MPLKIHIEDLEQLCEVLLEVKLGNLFMQDLAWIILDNEKEDARKSLIGEEDAYHRGIIGNYLTYHLNQHLGAGEPTLVQLKKPVLRITDSLFELLKADSNNSTINNRYRLVGESKEIVENALNAYNSNFELLSRAFYAYDILFKSRFSGFISNIRGYPSHLQNEKITKSAEFQKEVEKFVKVIYDNARKATNIYEKVMDMYQHADYEKYLEDIIQDDQKLDQVYVSKHVRLGLQTVEQINTNLKEINKRLEDFTNSKNYEILGPIEDLTAEIIFYMHLFRTRQYNLGNKLMTQHAYQKKSKNFLHNYGLFKKNYKRGIPKIKLHEWRRPELKTNK